MSNGKKKEQMDKEQKAAALGRLASPVMGSNFDSVADLRSAWTHSIERGREMLAQDPEVLEAFVTQLASRGLVWSDRVDVHAGDIPGLIMTSDEIWEAMVTRTGHIRQSEPRKLSRMQRDLWHVARHGFLSEGTVMRLLSARDADRIHLEATAALIRNVLEGKTW